MSNRQKAATFDFLGIPHTLKTRAAPKPSGEPLEADVLRAVTDLLAVHPRVLFALRQNSGAASYQRADGTHAPLWMYKWIRSPEPITLPDVWGMLYTGRLFFFELKRPGWSKPTDDRERRQALFLDIVREKGAIAEFITDAEEINALLA